MNPFSAIINSFRKAKKAKNQITKWLAWVESIKPVGSFENLPCPDIPDYSNLNNWAAHPDIEDKTHFTPEGIEPSSTAPQADVFFLHPTTFFGRNHWNAPLDHHNSKIFVDEMIIPGQASVFNSCCRIFAPRYRQATFYSFMEGGKNSRQALELAYEDLASAFDHYIKNWNEGRPFFIAGHSQGTLHAVRLLEEKIENTSLFKQFIAAYAIGFRFPKDKFGLSLKNIKACTSPTDTGCVIAWDTFAEGGKPPRRLERREHWYPTADQKGRWERCGSKAPLGINPLSWNQRLGMVGEAKNLGAVSLYLDNSRISWEGMWSNEPLHINAAQLSTPNKAEVSAQVKEDGFLYISKPKHTKYRGMLLPRGNYHMYDYALFYMNIRKNVEERLRAF